MEELLKLLFSNIYIVIIVVGFLLTLLNKARGKQNPGGNKMPPFGGGGTTGRPAARPLSERPAQPERPRQRDTGLPAQPRPAESRMQSPAAEAESPLRGSLYAPEEPASGEGVSSEFMESRLPGRTMEAAVPQSKGRMIAAPSPSSGGSDSFRVPQGNELRQAFIMAEVLGPPRSKRPLNRK
ncbi:hypothetical protein [Paenibacillus glycinis]|uniref:Uncharacterized protein n=1 Tax=Paenibacillus glycinis TaxID=2697035 RepID=A0ABW9XK73_9BACL|nr:hypothetical protein [Paenibacillus glycinis]NBD22857.1 hypothetical protein [Paenibacillus glycinis]